MEAEKEVDVMVEEALFGRRVDPDGCGCTDCCTGQTTHLSHVPPRSTDMARAWEVVEAMRENADTRFRTLRIVAYPYGRSYATFHPDPDDEDWSEANGEHATPRAICLAALAALQNPAR